MKKFETVEEVDAHEKKTDSYLLKTTLVGFVLGAGLIIKAMINDKNPSYNLTANVIEYKELTNIKQIVDNNGIISELDQKYMPNSELERLLSDFRVKDVEQEQARVALVESIESRLTTLEQTGEMQHYNADLDKHNFGVIRDLVSGWLLVFGTYALCAKRSEKLYKHYEEERWRLENKNNEFAPKEHKPADLGSGAAHPTKF